MDRRVERDSKVCGKREGMTFSMVSAFCTIFDGHFNFIQR